MSIQVILSKRLLLSLFLSLIFSAVVYAQFNINGFADSYLAARIKEPHDFLSSRSRLRLEANMYFENTHLFASFNAMKNYVLEDQDGIELREVYFDYVADNWDLRVGRQIIIWGKADGMQITDQISPYDMTEFLARDYDDIRMPVDAFKLRLLILNADLELLWLPIFQPGIMPGKGSPWAPVLDDLSQFNKINYSAALEPEKTLDSGEFGGRLSFFLSGIDLSLAALYTWSDFPVSNMHVFGDSLSIESEYYRYSFIGADFSSSLSDFVLRGETAYFLNNRFTSTKGIIERNSLKALLGVDWYPGNEWTVSAQIADDFILDYNKAINADEHQWISTISISKSLFRNTLKLSTFAYVGLNEKEIFNRSSLDYALTDELHILAGVDIIGGRSSGMFGQYKDNSEIWIKAKYSF